MNCKEIIIRCEDGYELKGVLYPPKHDSSDNKVLIINSATAVSQAMYRSYALFMAEKGFRILTYDYRGIAASRPKKLKGFSASFTEWAEKDVSAVLNFIKSNYSDSKILVLGHSIGGTLVGMTPQNHQIAAVLNIGAQTAYYKDWKKDRYKLYFLWHCFFPTVTRLVGYFPGKKLKLLEDVPKGVVDQWHLRRKKANMVEQLQENGIKVYYPQYEGILLTLAISDDPIGTESALLRIHNLFENAAKSYQTIHPNDVGVKRLGILVFLAEGSRIHFGKKPMSGSTRCRDLFIKQILASDFFKAFNFFFPGLFYFLSS